MIAPLRRAHRWIWIGLLGTVPLLVAAARSVSPERFTADAAFAEPALAGTALTFVPERARGATHGDGTLEVYLRDEAPLVVAYWSGTTDASKALPPDAVWLGAVDALHVARLRLPSPSPRGVVLLYDLGHHTIFARASLEAGAGTGG